MIRFLPAADWHIRRKTGGHGEASRRVRDVPSDSIRRVRDIAKQREAARILVTRGVFEDNAVDHLLVRRSAICLPDSMAGRIG